VKHNIYILLHACLATVRLLHSWAVTLGFFFKKQKCVTVPFVDEIGTVCGEVPLEYGFEVLIRSEQHRVCFLMHNCVIFSSAPSVQTQKTLVSDNSVMCDTTKLISIGFGPLC